MSSRLRLAIVMTAFGFVAAFGARSTAQAQAGPYQPAAAAAASASSSNAPSQTAAYGASRWVAGGSSFGTSQNAGNWGAKGTGFSVRSDTGVWTAGSRSFPPRAQKGGIWSTQSGLSGPPAQVLSGKDVSPATAPASAVTSLPPAPHAGLGTVAAPAFARTSLNGPNRYGASRLGAERFGRIGTSAHVQTRFASRSTHSRPRMGYGLTRPPIKRRGPARASRRSPSSPAVAQPGKMTPLLGSLNTGLQTAPLQPAVSVSPSLSSQTGLTSATPTTSTGLKPDLGNNPQ